MLDNIDFIKDYYKQTSNFINDIKNEPIKGLCNAQYILRSKSMLQTLNYHLDEYIKTREMYDKLLNLIFDQEYIDFKLSQLGDSLVLNEYKKLWSRERPTTGYCYILTEVLYHYLDLGLEPYSMKVSNGTHWFLGNKFGYIIDMTANQFDYKLDYSIAKPKSFYKGTVETSKGYISERGYELAKHLKLA